MIKRPHVVVLAMVSALSGCDGAEAISTDLDLGEASVLVQRCPESLSLKPSYRARQGEQLEGLSGPSFTVTGGRVGCETVFGLVLQGTELAGDLPTGPIRGSGFVGAALNFTDVNGMTGEVAVTQVDVDPMDPSGETLLYTLVTYDASTGQVNNVCKADAEGRAAAIPLRGRWDQTGTLIEDGSISFHCTSGVNAKCVRWGYKPWQSVQGVSLSAHHQACTRMARADYCGDGETHTQDGTQIDIYDSVGLLTPSPGGLMLFEATWGTKGAYCIARDRWLILSALLTPNCQNQFELSIQSSPMNALDLCFVRRIGAGAEDALMSNRTGINIGL
jgi:hypothetical protein